MAYVDIGWPWGLCLLAYNCSQASGWWIRRYLVSTLMLLHGFRMSLGGALLFGKMTNFTYIFKEDLQRYKFAKHRWSQVHGMPESTWWIKAQHDTLQQCLANSIVLAAPVIIQAVNPKEELNFLEIIGWAVWVCAWLYENVADAQKRNFLLESSRIRKKLTKTIEDGSKTAGKDLEELNKAVNGQTPPFTNNLWSQHRHPNYFGEWCCWLGFAISAIPSVQDLCSGSLQQCAYYLMLFYTIRVFYDCLVHWTGAGPAEHFSALKRGKNYTEY